jgi:N-acetylmuramoyl-L-alanine amidase
MMGIFKLLLAAIMALAIADTPVTPPAKMIKPISYRQVSNTLIIKNLMDYADGFVDYKSTSTEKKADNSATVATKYSQEDVELIAKTLYGECRGEDDFGRLAVAQCIVDRRDSVSFDYATIRDVVTSRNQFKGYRDENPVWLELADVAERALSGDRVFPEYEIHYFQRSKAETMYKAPRIDRIGKHSFYGYKQGGRV